MKNETLELLAVDHPYYCSDSNFYSNEPRERYQTMTAFLDDFEHCDIDMNLMFRWDIRNSSDDEDGKKAGRYEAEVFLMLQRKGIFKPVMISSVNEVEAQRFKIYAQKHWEVLNNIWSPISPERTK